VGGRAGAEGARGVVELGCCFGAGEEATAAANDFGLGTLLGGDGVGAAGGFGSGG
jgi:hypothetical protein